MSETNEIKPKEADSKVEREVLGFLADEAAHVGYGKLILEVNVHNGKLTNIQATEVRRSYNLNS
jgi:hypothetical protein